MRYIILTLSLILGLATSVSGDDLPTAGEILQEGQIVYKHADITDTGYDKRLSYLSLYVIYDKKYYNCYMTDYDLSCELVKSSPTTVR